MILKKGSLKKLPALLKVTFFNTLHTLPITVACMAVATLTANAIFHLSECLIDQGIYLRVGVMSSVDTAITCLTVIGVKHIVHKRKSITRSIRPSGH